MNMGQEDNGKFAPTIWIKVNVSESMFSSEYVIKLKLADGKTVTFFADKNLVNTENGTALLKATLVEENPDKNTNLVLLPSHALETATMWAEVPNA